MFIDKVPQNTTDSMVIYLKSAKKHLSEIPHIAFNIIVSNCVEFEKQNPKRGVVEAGLRLSKKVLVIWKSTP